MFTKKFRDGGFVAASQLLLLMLFLRESILVCVTQYFSTNEWIFKKVPNNGSLRSDHNAIFMYLEFFSVWFMGKYASDGGYVSQRLCNAGVPVPIK